jgi:type I restriction enzyme, S subunit
MKKAWQTKTLGEVCAFDKAQGIHHLLPYVGLEHIESHTARFIGSTEPQSVRSSTFRFSSEHVLYGRLRPYLNKVLAPDFEGHCSTEIFPIKPSPQLSRAYLLYWFLADSTVDRINATCTGARMPRADMNDVLKFDFPLPPLPEQQRVVGILDQAFAGVATAKANAEKNLQNARALFESHLQSVFTQRGARWVEKSLSELCQFENGDRGKNYPNRNEYVESGIPWINTGHIQLDGTLSQSEMNFITREKYDSLRSGKIQPGDLVYCLRGATLGKTAMVDPLKEGAVASSLVIIRPKAHLDGRFLYFFLTSPLGRGLIKGYENGAAQPNLGAKSVAKYPISLPPLNDQKEIVDYLFELRAETQRLASIYECKLAALEALKKSLLHQAFTGQL